MRLSRSAELRLHAGLIGLRKEILCSLSLFTMRTGR
jgi:hypothetical protein